MLVLKIVKWVLPTGLALVAGFTLGVAVGTAIAESEVFDD